MARYFWKGWNERAWVQHLALANTSHRYSSCSGCEFRVYWRINGDVVILNEDIALMSQARPEGVAEIERNLFSPNRECDSIRRIFAEGLPYSNDQLGEAYRRELRIAALVKRHGEERL